MRLTLNPVHHHAESSAKLLTELAHAKVLAALNHHGNNVGPIHALALHQLMEGMSNQALGIAAGRFAYGLPPGTGKTQSVIAWLAATWELGLGLSVSVSAAQIEALCDIKRDLIAACVPANRIGLRHTYGADATEPDTGEADRPIMLVSHARIRGGRNATLFSHHLDRPRDLLIWDETLMTTRAESLSWQDVKTAAGRVGEDVPPGSALSSCLKAAVEALGHEVEAQESAPPAPSILIDASDLEAAQEQARVLGDWGSPMRRAAVKTIQTLMTMVARPVAVARTRSGASGDGVIRYSVAVDPETRSVSVRDGRNAELWSFRTDYEKRTTTTIEFVDGKVVAIRQDRA
jgi:hypothetical protein